MPVRALLLACILASGIAHAQGVDLGAIAQRSDAIILARCVATQSHWDADARVIVTDVTLEVERSFKGDAASIIDVRTLGGQVGAVGMGAAHASTFAPGARVVALLRRSHFGSYFVISAAHGATLAVTDRAGGGASVAVGNALIRLEELAQWLATNVQ